MRESQANGERKAAPVPCILGERTVLQTWQAEWIPWHEGAHLLSRHACTDSSLFGICSLEAAFV